MRYLIAYASTEGQAEKIARYMDAALSASGHTVLLHNVSGLSGGLSVSDFDKVIIAGSVHSAKHQSDLELFVFANRDRLNALPGLFVSVSLAAAFPDTRQDAAAYAETFLKAAQWTPTQTVLVAGAVKPGNYDWFDTSVLLEGDLSSHFNEDLQETRDFTDWDALTKQVSDFSTQ